jgi:hypothetical protein
MSKYENKLPDQSNSICSICGAKYQGLGNNADPYHGLCCDSCNEAHVIPSRIAMMMDSAKL